LTDAGYTVRVRMPGAFDGAPLSTLQPFHAPNVVVLETPAATLDCLLELIVPDAAAAFTAVDAPITKSPAWVAGLPTDPPSRGGTQPFYTSGADADTGDIAIGPFEACRDVVVPFAVGPIRRDLALVIRRERDGGAETLFDGVPPGALN